MNCIRGPSLFRWSQTPSWIARLAAMSFSIHSWVPGRPSSQRSVPAACAMASSWILSCVDTIVRRWQALHRASCHACDLGTSFADLEQEAGNEQQ